MMQMLQTVIETFLKVERSPYTNRNYALTLNRMADAVGGKRNIERITFADLLDYVHGMADVKPTTRYAYVNIIKIFFRWCVRLDYLSKSPADPLNVRVPKDNPGDRSMPADILAAMIAASRYHPRNYAMLNFFKDTGCRRGGVASLRITYLNLDRRTSAVIKKGGDIYTVQFSRSTAQSLDAWLSVRPKVDHDYVFISQGSRNHHQPLDPDGVSAIIRKISKQVCGKGYGPHSIRHTLGHTYANAGIPISVTRDKLGHSNTRDTERYYPNGTEEILRQLVEEIDPTRPPSKKIIKLPRSV